MLQNAYDMYLSSLSRTQMYIDNRAPPSLQMQTAHDENMLPAATSSRPVISENITTETLDSLPPRFSTSNLLTHGQQWKTSVPEGWINGKVRGISCVVKGPDLTVIEEGTAPEKMTFLEFFMWMFPLRHLHVIVSLTNDNLQRRSAMKTTSGEILKFFGVLLLITRCKFSDRRELWSPVSHSPCLPNYNFGKIMSRDRFEILRSCIRFSEQSDIGGVYTEANQWELVEGFVDAINMHRSERVRPSHMLCVDESILRWYGLGGAWIDVGSPHFVKLERKPEYGLEMQDVACGSSGLLLGIKLVKSKDLHGGGLPSNHNHGTDVLIDLCDRWADKERIICADSYFGSVEAGEALLKKNLRFIGKIKTATKRFPMTYFGKQEMFDKGAFRALSSSISTDEDAGDRDVAALCWLDRNRRHFVATAGSISVKAVQERVRWRQHEDGACPVEISVTMPELVKDYYAVAGIIDQHNRVRQDSVDLEKSVEVKDWSFRANCTLLGMIFTDSWLLYKFGCRGRVLVKPHVFWSKLATQLVENSFDNVGGSNRSSSTNSSDDDIITPRCGSGTHLTPTKTFRRGKNGSPNIRKQGRCAMSLCRQKTTWVCSTCQQDGNGDIFLFHGRTGRSCFEMHEYKSH